MMNVHRGDVWKVIAVIGGACVFAVAHKHELPALLTRYQDAIEAVAFVWSVIQAQRMMPPRAVKQERRRKSAL